MSAAAIALFSVSGVAGIATAAFASQCGWRCFSPRGAELWLARIGTQPALTRMASYLIAILPLLARWLIRRLPSVQKQSGCSWALLMKPPQRAPKQRAWRL